MRKKFYIDIKDYTVKLPGKADCYKLASTTGNSFLFPLIISK